MKQGILTRINDNLKKCFIILILTFVLNVVAFVIALSYSSAVCLSSFFALMLAIYAISNVSGAKFGRLFNMHIIRWHYLRSHDMENIYQTSCLKYIAVLLPASVIWSIVNVFVAVAATIIGS